MEAKLQNRLFAASDENVVLAVEVTKPKKSSHSNRKGDKLILCLTTAVSASAEVHISIVKNVEKSDKYKMKKQWTLNQLKMVDAKDLDEDNSFVMTFQKAYRFVFDSRDSADAFLAMLWKFCNRILGQKPIFDSIPDRVISAVESKHEGLFSLSGTSKGKDADEDEKSNKLAAIQSEISEKEEASLERSMAGFEDALGNMERFTQHLKECLEGLDGANIYSIITADEKLNDLMDTVNSAERQANRLEQKVEQYISVLSSVDDQLTRLQDRDTLVQVKQKNIKQLTDVLDDVVNKYELPREIILILKSPDLKSKDGIRKVSLAAAELRRIKMLPLPEGLEKMQFISDQQRRLQHYEVGLAQTVSHNVNNTILHQANTLLLSAQQPNLNERVQSHKPAQASLAIYDELVSWLSTVSEESTENLAQTYVEMFARVANAEFKMLNEALANGITEATSDRASLSSDHDRKKKLSKSAQSLMSNEPQRDTYRHAIMRATNLLIENIQNWYFGEKDFCNNFFSLKSDRELTETLLQKGDIGTHLVAYLAFVDRQEALNSVYILLRFTDWTQTLKSKGDHALQKLAASTLLHAKRAFDANVKSIIQVMEQFSVNKKKRVGILPFSQQFETFGREAEAVFSIVGHRHADIDKAYNRIVNTVFNQMTRVANEQQKVMPAVVLMENFSVLYSVLSELKIPTLEHERKLAREHQQRELQILASNALEPVMTSLMAFVDSANALIARGVKPEEVHFNAQFSRAEMHRLVTHNLNHKELQKQLHHVCEKLRKNLTDDSATLAVVFGRLQEIFLVHFAAVEQLVNQSYPGLRIDITQSDVQRFFSDISKNL